MSPINPDAELEFDMSPAVVAALPFYVTVRQRTGLDRHQSILLKPVGGISERSI